MKFSRGLSALAVAGATLAGLTLASGSLAQHGGGVGSDTREFVKLPEMMNAHMLANMRDHLLAVQQIQQAMAAGQWDEAAMIAEKRLGMSSLDAHGASHIAGFMPEGMQAAGTSMHRAASRFAIKARDAGVSPDWSGVTSAFAEVLQSCNGCHAGYRTR